MVAEFHDVMNKTLEDLEREAEARAAQDMNGMSGREGVYFEP